VVRVKLLIAVTAAVLAVALTSASAAAAGLNLSWDDCGSHGTQVQAFACDTNAGQHTMVGSFVAPEGIELMSANEVFMELQVNAPTIPDWWQVRTGACRPASTLTGNWDFTAGPYNCYDYWQGGAIGGWVEDAPQFSFPIYSQRIRGVFALPTGDLRITSVPPGTEVYSFKLSIKNSKSTGLGACIGCEAGACIILTDLNINQPSPYPPRTFIQLPEGRNYVSWQCITGRITNEENHPEGLCTFPGCPTPVRAQSWGQIKQLYR
jgi:hypothetical protein